MLVQFAQWLDSQAWSTALHESLYMYSWVETTHVLTLTVFLGMLIMIDLRLLGLCLTSIPVSKISARLNTPMLIGFAVMVVTGLLLYYAIPVRTTQSVWFRLKVILLVAAGINAWLFHRHMRRSVDSWDADPVPPTRTRVAGGISLALWAGVVTCGRFIAYNWFDCDVTQSDFIYWAAGCAVEA